MLEAPFYSLPRASTLPSIPRKTPPAFTPQFSGPSHKHGKISEATVITEFQWHRLKAIASDNLSFIGGGIFLCLVFAYTGDDDDDISKSTVLILSSVFTVCTIGAAVLMALLRMPPMEDTLLTEASEAYEQDNRQKPSHRELLGKFIWDPLI